MQGAIGDCYFMSSLAETALRDPSIISSMLIDNGDGTYTVRFFNNGVADYVTVDRQLPVSSLTDPRFVYANLGLLASDPNVKLWVALVEKAFVEINAKWGIQPNRGNNPGNYYDAISLGSPIDALNAITGLWEAGNSVYSAISAAISSWTAGSLICFYSNSQQSQGSPVMGNHVYALVDYNARNQEFTLFNPWGTSYGLLTLSWNQIEQYYSGYVATANEGNAAATVSISDLSAEGPLMTGLRSIVPSPKTYVSKIVPIIGLELRSANPSEISSDEDSFPNAWVPKNTTKYNCAKVPAKRIKNSNRRVARFFLKGNYFQALGDAGEKHFSSEPLSYET